LLLQDKDTKDKIAEALPEIKAEVKTIIVEAAYWRKANAIHGWFVDKVQEGVDDCGEYNVTLEQLQDLVALCKEILSNKEKALEDFIKKIIQGTEWQGKVFIVGGYVRDEFMGKDPKDLDLLVNAV
jgi:hypothetical protein